MIKEAFGFEDLEAAFLEHTIRRGRWHSLFKREAFQLFDAFREAKL